MQGATWAALVFAERQSCSLAMDLVVKRIPALKERLVTGALRNAPLNSAVLQASAYPGPGLPDSLRPLLTSHTFCASCPYTPACTACTACQAISQRPSGPPAGTLKSHNALMSTTNQGAVISQFRNGDLNALFCTSVAEEGLDIQKVSLVICYDIPKRPLSMVQTVGRARSRESRVLFMRAMHASGAKAKVPPPPPPPPPHQQSLTTHGHRVVWTASDRRRTRRKLPLLLAPLAHAACTLSGQGC